MKKVAVIMGSDSDWPVMKESVQILKEFEVDVHYQVVSAHRTPEDLQTFASWAETEGISTIIAGAGGAAHLPGMMASFTYLPVIGVPIKTKSLSGIDSLYSIVQMPKGVPVATVAINNSTNAALLAIKILSIYDESLRERLKSFRINQANDSREKTKNLIL